ncbi:MAG TPA: efflux RND transporter periplasmic adaptor subunit [archaeon]|nr:efflux RND transporter periplasmic adaptor subunit [archaeon]
MRMPGSAELIGLVAFTVAGFGSCSDKKVSEVAAAVPTPVRTVKIVEEEIPRVVRACGITTSSKQMKLSFKTGGIVKKILVEDGDRVIKGKVLAELDLTEIEARLSQAEIAFEKAHRDLNRVRNLFRDSVVTTEQLQDATSAFNNVSAELEITRYNLRHSSIKAPSDGLILKRLVEENELVSPGMSVFVFSSSEAGFVLRVGVSDREILNLALGDSAAVSFDTFGERRFTAVVSEMPAGSSYGMFEIELTLLDMDVTLLTGMVGCAEIYSHKVQRFPVVPVDALVDAEADRAFVFIRQGEVVRRKAVRLGSFSGENVAVLEGLLLGQEVVKEGVPYLSDGSRVKLIPDE